MISINTDYGTISPYSIMILTSLVIGMIILFILDTKRGLDNTISSLHILVSLVATVIGGLLLTLIISLGKSIGFSSLGGLAGMYAGGILIAMISRQPYHMKLLAQNTTLTLPIMYSISKIGCFLAGCCRGIGHIGLCSVVYIDKAGSMSVIPIQLIESIIFLAIFAVGIWLWMHKNKYTIHLVFITSAMSKFVLDFLRESHAGVILSMTQVLCLLLIIIDIMLLVRHKLISNKIDKNSRHTQFSM